MGTHINYMIHIVYTYSLYDIGIKMLVRQLVWTIKDVYSGQFPSSQKVQHVITNFSNRMISVT